MAQEFLPAASWPIPQPTGIDATCNGERLARLMIQHEVGVRARKTYVLRSVDEDYFADL
jgi:hypothetical protein